MGKTQALIDEPVKQFIEKQSMFFVATAPLDPNGLVNLSLKGLDSIRILAPDTVAYLDLTGSGVETIAHVKENGRLVIMFCAFEGPPNILRIHGRARVVEANDPEFASLASHFNPIEGMRAIIVMKVQRVADSCGWAVPLLKFEKDRHQLIAWANPKRSRRPEAIPRRKKRHQPGRPPRPGPLGGPMGQYSIQELRPSSVGLASSRLLEITSAPPQDRHPEGPWFWPEGSLLAFAFCRGLRSGRLSGGRLLSHSNRILAFHFAVF
jgi:hypothetical protein